MSFLAASSLFDSLPQGGEALTFGTFFVMVVLLALNPRRRKLAVVAGLAGTVALGGWFAQQKDRFPVAAIQALRNDPNAVFYALDPEPTAQDARESIERYRILGQVVLSAAADREQLASAVAAASAGAWETGMACFHPRHAFRASGRKGKYEMLLCFECGKAVVMHPDGREQKVPILDRPHEFNLYLRARLGGDAVKPR